MAWILAVGDPAPTLAPSRELAEATGRRFTFRIDGSADAQFSFTGEAGPWATDHEAREVVPLATDLHAWRDGDRIFRGRCASRSGASVAGEDDGPDTYSVQWTAFDYRWMLNRRQIGVAGRVFGADTQDDYVLTLINESEALSGGDWGVDLGTNSGTPTARSSWTLDPGQPIGEAIASLGRTDGGFEWEVAPDSTGDLKLNLWHDPGRGADNGVILDYGGLVAGFSDVLDPETFANSVLATGDLNLVPETAVTAGIGTDPRGRWERSFGFPTIKEQDTLDGRATFLVDQASVLRPEYIVELTAGYWQGRSHLWLGDIVQFVVKVGDLDVVADHRVVEVSIVVDDEDEETVSLGLLAVS